MLVGIVEADEAYVLESQKGIPVTTRKRENMVNPQQNAAFPTRRCVFVLPLTGSAVMLCAALIEPSPPPRTSRKPSESGSEKTVCFCVTGHGLQQPDRSEEVPEVVLNT